MNTKKIKFVETEEEANEACFQQLESDLENYYSQIDAQEEEYDRQSIREWNEEKHIQSMRDKNGNYTTIRMARIIANEVLDEDELTYIFRLEALNCSLPEFLEWFILTVNGKHFTTKNDSLVITHEIWQKMHEESVEFIYDERSLLWITFDDYFTAFVGSMIDDRQRNQITVTS